MLLFVSYLYWLNVATFALIAYDRHNASYGLWRLPRWLPVALACFGGFYGWLMARLLFGKDRRSPQQPSIPWGRRDRAYVPPGKRPVDDTPVPGWGDHPIDDPDLPDPHDNKPTPPAPHDIIAPPPDGEPIQLVGNEIIVILNTDDAERDMKRFVHRWRELYPDKNRYSVSYYNATTRLMRLLVPHSERIAIMDRIEKEMGGELDFLLTDNYVFADNFMPTAPAFQMSDVRRYYNLIQAPAAWDITQGSPDVTVAIVDTYFALDHPDLQDRWRDPVSISKQTRDVLPPAGNKEHNVNHGSHVAGIAIGNGQGSGAMGIAPKCSWIPVSLGFPMYGHNVLEGVLYAIYKGADVINLSIGAMFTDEVLQLPLDRQFDRIGKVGVRLQHVWEYVTRLANERKCVIVWAAGNENVVLALDGMKRNTDAIKVSALTANGQKADFSNFGNFQQYHAAYSTLSAPGVGILSCVGNSEYARWNGTSMAAPFVAGAVALMKSLDRSLTTREVIDILTETGRKTRPEEHIGPMIQVRDALLRVKKGLMHFDDMTRGDGTLLGSWEATKHLVLVNEKDEYLDDLLIFFHFSTQTEGKLTFRSVNAGNIYEARISLTMDKKQVVITQLEQATCHKPGVLPIRIYSYHCQADADGLLYCTAKENGIDHCNFHLRKYHN